MPQRGERVLVAEVFHRQNLGGPAQNFLVPLRQYTVQIAYESLYKRTGTATGPDT